MADAVAPLVGSGQMGMTGGLALGALVTPPGRIARTRPEWLEEQRELYDPRTTKRILGTWIASPTVAAIAAYGVFYLMKTFDLVSI